MDKVKTSKKQKSSSKKSKPLILVEHRPEDFNFNKPKLVREILADCILNNDMDTFQDVFLAFIRNQSKTKLAEKSKLGRQTLYDLLNDKKGFNPEWDTLRSLLKAI
jgi:DNA-binding phage protein